MQATTRVTRRAGSACVCTCSASNGGGNGQVPLPTTGTRSARTSSSRRRHASSKASASSTSSSSNEASTTPSPSPSSKSIGNDGVGTWPNSFEPLILDSRYINHYRDPSKHDHSSSSSSASHIPLSKRSRAAWFAPSTGNSIITKLPSSDTGTPQLHDGDAATSQRYSKARNARREMEKAWGASSSLLALNSSNPTPTSKTQGHSSAPSLTGGNKKKKATKTALLFPGSGSQYVGMASFLDDYRAARDTWEEAEEALSEFEEWRKDLKLHELPELKHLNLLEWPVWQKERSPTELRQIVKNGPQDELTRSSNSQPAICITSIALLRTLEQEYHIPISSRASYFAGHSSGEYSACVASGVISFAEGVHLTRLHGLLTSRALQLSSLKTYSDHSAKDEERAQMSAIMLMNDSNAGQVEDVIQKVKRESEGNQRLVEIASYNSSRQLVLSGSRAGVLRACEKLEDEEIAARAADLPVFAPFHCSFMAPAAAGMTHAWNHGVKAKAPRAPIVSNLDAALVNDPIKLKRDIVASIHAPVLWSSAMNKMKNEEHVKRFIFVGPGKALANLARKEIKSGTWKGTEGLQIGTVATEECMRNTSELCRDLMEDIAGEAEERVAEAAI